MQNKALIITNIIILSTIIVGLIIFMVWGLGTNHKFFDVKQDKLYTKTYNLDEITKIKTNVKSYDLEFKESINDLIKVEIYGNEKNKRNIKLGVNNNELYINETGSIICFGFCFSSNKAVIYLPKKYTGEFDITTVSGDIDILVDALNNVNLKTTSGDVSTKTVKDAKITTTSGDVRILKGSNIEISSVSGNIKIEETKKVKAKTTSGDVDIQKITNSLDIKTTSGDIEIENFTIKENSKAESVSGEVTIKLLNEAFVSAETKSGDKDIKAMRNPGSDLYIKTISGDITVE